MNPIHIAAPNAKLRYAAAKSSGAGRSADRGYPRSQRPEAEAFLADWDGQRKVIREQLGLAECIYDSTILDNILAASRKHIEGYQNISLPISDLMRAEHERLEFQHAVLLERDTRLGNDRPEK